MIPIQLFAAFASLQTAFISSDDFTTVLNLTLTGIWFYHEQDEVEKKSCGWSLER